LRYLRDVGAAAAAEQLHPRVLSVLLNHLARFPRTGRRLDDRDLWEMWIPRTGLVRWYRIEIDPIEIATVWHTSQDRRSAAKR
jgi:plasmid stabilization system protein ParE